MSVRELFEESLSILRTEVHERYARFSRELGDDKIRVEVGAEKFTLERSARGAEVTAPSSAATVVIVTSTATLLDLVRGRTTVEDAVWEGHLDAYGDADDLFAAGRIFTNYLEGLMRAPSGPRLLGRLETTLGRRSQEVISA